VARALAQEIRAVYIHVDSIEVALITAACRSVRPRMADILRPLTSRKCSPECPKTLALGWMACLRLT
jgi:hypothetical protein